MRYLTKYKLFESSGDLKNIEQYLDDLFLELGDGNFIYTILTNPYGGNIKIIIGKYGYNVFGYEEVKDLVNHAVSYLKENGYELLPDTQKDLPYYDDTCLKSLELKFRLTGVKESKQDIESDIIHIFEDLTDEGFRVSVCMEDGNEYVYIDREDGGQFDGPTVVEKIERLKIFLKGTPFEPTDVYYSTTRSTKNKSGVKNGIDRFIFNCKGRNNQGHPHLDNMKIIKIYLK